MEPLSTAIASTIGKLLMSEVAKAGVAGVKSYLQPDKMEQVLKDAIESAQATQPETGGLFFRCQPKAAKEFLEKFFHSDPVFKELQKPLKDDGKPDVDILILAFDRSAKQYSAMQDYISDSSRSWIEKFVECYFEQIQGIYFQVAKAQYLEQLARRVDDVKFVGIAVPGEEVEKQEVLAQIFVMPDVREECSKGMTHDIDYGCVIDSAPDDLPAEEYQRLVSYVRQKDLQQEQRAWAMRDRSSPRIPAPKILNLSQKKAVILGAPGSGKTMLVSYFALMLCETQQSDPTQIGLEPNADYLPVVVRIRDWILQPKMGLLEYLEYYAKTNLCTKELPTGFFEHWLERGRALILLDGLDEVVDEAQRCKVAEQIETFLHRYPSNPAVITSRPAGYRWDFFNLDEFPHHTLESFDDKQVATFIDHWYDSRLKDDTAQAARRKADLQSAFARNERIRLLAKNPLLLTIITLIHRYQAELPRQRFKLYEKAVETLLTSWDSGKEIKLYETVLRFLKPDDLLYVLKKVAYWIHTQGSTGETEGGTLIDKDELLRQLQRDIKTLKKCEPHEAKGEAERFIDFIQRRTGLLNEQGRDRYAFVHKTFQEYLTAEEIFDRADVEDDTDIILSHFRAHLHDQHWREVLLLLVSKLKGKKAQKAIQTVLDAGSEYEQWLHRDLLFAGWCLTEDPPELTLVAGDLVGEILDRVVSLEVETSERVGSRIKNEVAKVLSCFGQTTLEQVVWEKLKLMGEKIDELRLLELQASLGYRENAINILISLLENQHGLFSIHAVHTLIKLGEKSNDKVISCLTRLLDSEQPFIFREAAKILFQSGNSKDEIEKHFLVRLDERDSITRIGAAQILVELGNSDERLVSSLVLLLKDNSYYVRSNATLALSQLGNTDSEVVSGLLSALNDKESSVRFMAAQALGNLGTASLEVINCLVSLLVDKNASLRASAAEAIGKLGNTDSEVINGLLSLLADESSSVRASTAEALVRLGNVSSDVVNILLSLLKYESSFMRSDVVEALGKLAKTSNKICPEVVQWLQQNPNGDEIGSAIDCLWSIVVE